jgi:hypothetical protein
MKLILENWKKFIVEVTQQEQSYFGKTIQIANQIVKELDEWKATLQDKSHDSLKKEMNNFANLLKQKIPNLNFLGAGKFRAAFSTDEDVVIKVDYTNGSIAKEQNQADAEVGRLAQDPKFSYLFAKSFLSDENSRWVILERVKPLTGNYSKFNEFFNTPTINQITKNPQLITLYIRACLLYDTKADDALKDLMRSINKIKAQEGNRDQTPIRKLVEDLRKSNLFTDLVRVCQKYQISPWEIKPDNVGVTEDNRFVIIDSSKLEQINTALTTISSERSQQKIQQNTNAQDVTVPLKR